MSNKQIFFRNIQMSDKHPRNIQMSNKHPRNIQETSNTHLYSLSLFYSSRIVFIDNSNSKYLDAWAFTCHILFQKIKTFTEEVLRDQSFEEIDIATLKAILSQEILNCMLLVVVLLTFFMNGGRKTMSI